MRESVYGKKAKKIVKGKINKGKTLGGENARCRENYGFVEIHKIIYVKK